MALPRMKTGTGKVRAVFKLAHYDCILVEKPEAIGPIKYFFMLIVSEKGSKSPKFVVTCEHNTLQKEILKLANLPNLENPPIAYTCYFDENGNHFIHSPLNETPKIEAFQATAFEIVNLKLNISENPVLIESSGQGLVSFDLIKTALSKLKLFWQQKSKIILASLLILLIVLVILFGKSLIKPENYNDCILDNMQGVSSDIAARVIKDTCYKKHAKKVTKKFLNYKGVKNEFLFDATNDQIVEALRDHFGGTDEDISNALATIEVETTYELD